MISVLSLDETIQEAVGETLAHGGYADMEAHQGLGLFDALQREFLQATIMAINLASLLEWVQGAIERENA
jgi:hypothetical protein